MWGPLRALWTYWNVNRSFDTRERFEAWQSAQVQKWIWKGPRHCQAFDVNDQTKLSDFPVMDKAVLMSNFEKYNRPMITAQQGWAAFEGTRMVDGYHVGASTGTSGNRGLFVISDEERFAWLGAILGKALPGFWKRKTKVAVILPLHTKLYDAAHGFGPIQLSFFDLTKGLDSWLDRLVEFGPTHIVAPPKILRLLAERSSERLPVEKVFSGAEVLDDKDAEIIREWADLGQIYMATEGLLAVSCAHGSLHLCEDIFHFELEPVKDNLVVPIISDFRRRTQSMVRYRLNDVLEMSNEPCACGSVHKVVERVVGREDDVFVFEDVAITPDVLRNAVVDADRSILDFRIVQKKDRVKVMLPLEVSATASSAVKKALAAVFERFGVSVKLDISTCELPLPMDKKLRRVVRET